MPLKNKRSDTPGNRANLIPGEIGHNRADDMLLIRGDLKKLEVDLDAWRRLAPPKEGVNGGLLRLDGSDLVWDTDIAPAAVVNGLISVDEPPENLGVPGVKFFDAADAFPFSTNISVIESFYVASDSINLTTLGVYFTVALVGQMRIGVARVGEDDMRCEVVVPSGTIGAEIRGVSATLERGHYIAMAWVETSATIKSLTGLRFHQGFEPDPGDGTPLFLKRRTCNLPMNAGLIPNDLPTTPLYTDTPGVHRSIFMKWALPT